MTRAPEHLCRVFSTPWPGVHGTLITSGRHYGRHSHEVFGFGLVEAGGQRSASGRGPVEALAGQVITVNPGEVHDGRPLDGTTRRWRMLYLEPAAFADWTGTAPGRVEIARPVIDDGALGRALEHLFACLESPQAQALAREEALVRACAQLCERHAAGATPQAVPQGMLRARERLAEALDAPPSLAELAVEAGLSRWQLLRRFEQAHGLPPHAWVLQLRAEKARRLIASGLSLAEAALQCGFADQSHLTRVFSRHFGYTPGTWQRSLQ